jgi:hypothetical protein
MPTNRTRRSRAWNNELDCYRIETLMNGFNAVLLAGTGYFPAQRGGLPSTASLDQIAEARDEMRRDWSVHGERLLHWWVTDENRPSVMKPWTFVSTPRPGERPWAWWQFEAPEPLPADETQREYLIRLGLMLPGEESMQTREERRAEQQAEIERNTAANIEAAIRKVQGDRK